MKQISLILPTTNDACEMAARECALWLQDVLLGFSILDTRGTAPREGPDEVIGDGVVRGWWRETRVEPAARDRSALVLVDLMPSDEASIEDVIREFVPTFFRQYRDAGESQKALYLGVQAARHVSFVKEAADQVWTLGVEQDVSGVKVVF